LILDTDISTMDRFPGSPVLIIGQNLLKGEGAGRNLKLGMIAFRSGIEAIMKGIEGRSPVLIAAGSEGGTGLAGAVELNAVLNRSGTPHFTFILTEEGRGSDPSRWAMAYSLITGPLRPGSIVPREEEMSLCRALGLFLRASSPSSGISLASEAWSRLRSGKVPFALELQDLSLSDISIMAEGFGPSLRGITIAAVEVPPTLSATDIRRAVDHTLGHSERIGVGIVEADVDHVAIAMISESVNPGPLPVGGSEMDLSKLLGEEGIEGVRSPDIIH
jgi:hypothetical protein